jgi:DNA-binding CsgD family transcriptional regulator
MVPDDPRRDGADVLRAHPAPHRHPTLGGAELVAVSERFYHWIFLGALAFVALSTAASAVFLPLRSSAVDGRPPTTALVTAIGVLLLAALAIWRAHALYRVLLLRPPAQFAIALVAALLLSVASPLRNELWWSSCAILMALATVVSLRRALAFCLLALLANLTAHLATGSIHETTPVGILGLWIGMPFWVATAAVVPDRMAAHILRLNASEEPQPPEPRRVRAWTSEPPAAPACDAAAPEAAAVDRARTAHHASPSGRTRELTARQLQVVALLAEGRRYRDIAECLSISAGQVHRHVSNATRRLGVRTVSELVAIAVADGVVSESSAPA